MYSSYMIKPRSTAKVISGLSENHTSHALLFKVKQGINVKTKKPMRHVQANVCMLKFTSLLRILSLSVCAHTHTLICVSQCHGCGAHLYTDMSLILLIPITFSRICLDFSLVKVFVLLTCGYSPKNWI